MSKFTPKQSHKAFTLIELLVVIAIIAILAAILFPVFAQARNKARQAACQSNLKQIGIAFQMYAQDYDETMPVWTTNACVPASASNFIYSYYYTVDPYIKNGATRNTDTPTTEAGTLRGVWACPSSKPQFGDSTAGYGYNYFGLGGTANCPTSAALGAGFAPFNGEQYKYPAPLSDLSRPAETFMIMDGNQLVRPPVDYAGSKSVVRLAVWGSHQIGTGVIAPATGPSANPDASVAATINKLMTGRLTTVVYADGHVKTVNTQTLLPKAVVMENGAWKGTLDGGNTKAGNAGWCRDW